MCKVPSRPGPRPPRRGSVLVLVVALLVLVAVIATAWVASTQSDRVATRQHAHNTQIDLLIEGVVHLATAQLESDLFGPPIGNGRPFRPPVRSDAPVTDPYEPYDSPQVDIYLADRVPLLPNPLANPDAQPSATTPLAPAGPSNPPVWRNLSWPLTENGPSGAKGEFRFDRPDGGEPIVLPPGSKQAGHFSFAPTSMRYNGQDAWPALMAYYDGVPYDPDGPGPLAPAPFPAADTDGDGIADAGLWQLPVGKLDGVTYYAAVRIIDNGSAINVNTALSRDNDFVFAGGHYKAWRDAPTYFTGRVGLAELLRTRRLRPDGLFGSTGLGSEMDELNKYRLAAGVVDGVRGTPAGRYSRPVGDGPRGRPVLRNDFVFMSVADALEHQLADRLYNPGYNTPDARYRPFDLAQWSRLGYHFCVRPNGLDPPALEKALSDSLFHSGPRATAVPDHPFRADEVAQWFDQFNYDAEIPADPSTYRQRRPLLVHTNALATQMPAKFDSPDPGTVGLNRIVNVELIQRGCVAPYGPLHNIVSPDPAHPVFADKPPTPPRTPINTATFNVLWRGFWNVMMDTPYKRDGAPVDEETVKHLVQKDPYYGSRFDPVTRESVTTELHPALMFRSSIRDVRDPRDRRKVRIEHFEPFDQMALRAALAAVNAEDIRDSDDDVTGHLIRLRANDAVLPKDVPDDQLPTQGDQVGFSHDAPAYVYGTEIQPYITEIYVNTDRTPDRDGRGSNAKGYIGIELHNPYDKPVVLSPPVNVGSAQEGWTIGLINRRADSALKKPFLRVENVNPAKNVVRRDPKGSGAYIVPDCPFPRGTVIPPHEYLVLENYDPEGNGVDAATHRPLALKDHGLPPSGRAQRAIYVPYLHRLLADPDHPADTGGEFVLLRTRKASAVRNAEYNEDWRIEAFVPADQFDFTGLSLERDGSTRATAMHYVRPNAFVGDSGYWKFVYPGRYDGRAVNGRHQGMRIVHFDRALPPDKGGGVEPDWGLQPGGPLALAGPDLQASYPNPFTIQLNNFGGINPLQGGRAEFPFGAFARNVDILQVPFIGAYTVFSDSDFITDDAELDNARLLEMNSVTMDSAFAEDTDVEDDPRPAGADTGAEDREQIGRFCPVAPGPRTTGGPNDLDGDGAYPLQVDSGPYNRGTWRYRWANTLFDYFTVGTPSSDFLPNVSPEQYLQYSSLRPLPVSNSGGTAGDPDPTDFEKPDDPLTDGRDDKRNDFAEDLEPVEGLVNVNTAPWKVLASLPLVTHTTDPRPGDTWKKGDVDVAATEEAAKAIVYYRDVDGDPAPNVTRPHGPFKSLCELNRALDLRPGHYDPTSPKPPHGFWDGFGSIDPDKDPDDAAGDLSPYNPALTGAEPGEYHDPPDLAGTDNARHDFEERYLTLARISNLVTTRSDTYTVYILLQGWRDAGTDHAELVVQRRLAFVADRSRVSPLSPTLNRTNFYND